MNIQQVTSNGSGAFNLTLQGIDAILKKLLDDVGLAKTIRILKFDKRLENAGIIPPLAPEVITIKKNLDPETGTEVEIAVVDANHPDWIARVGYRNKFRLACDNGGYSLCKFGFALEMHEHASGLSKGSLKLVDVFDVFNNYIKGDEKKRERYHKGRQKAANQAIKVIVNTVADDPNLIRDLEDHAFNMECEWVGIRAKDRYRTSHLRRRLAASRKQAAPEKLEGFDYAVKELELTNDDE